MSEPQYKAGTVAWTDLSVSDVPRIRDFYRAVIGWEPSAFNMGGWDDFNMNHPGTNQAASGVCLARGFTATIPPQWLIYVPVKDLEASLATCEKLGGKVLHRFDNKCCVIQDPAGALMVLMPATA